MNDADRNYLANLPGAVLNAVLSAEREVSWGGGTAMKAEWLGSDHWHLRITRGARAFRCTRLDIVMALAGGMRLSSVALVPRDVARLVLAARGPETWAASEDNVWRFWWRSENVVTIERRWPLAIGEFAVGELDEYVGEEKEVARNPNPTFGFYDLPLAVQQELACIAGCRGYTGTQAHPGWLVREAPEPHSASVERSFPNRIRLFSQDDICDAIKGMTDEEASAVLGYNAAEGKTMTEPTKKDDIIKTLTTDATDAAWRTAGSQFVKLARDPLAALISRHLAPEDESVRNKLAEFLRSDTGTAMLAGLLSIGLTVAPVDSNIKERLSRELRVRSLADAGDLVAEIIMGPLRQVMSLYLQDVPGIVAQATAAIEAPAVRAVEDPKIKVAVKS